MTPRNPKKPHTKREPAAKESAPVKRNDDTSTPVFRRFMLTPGVRERLTEEYKRHGFESDNTIVNAISTTDPKIDFSDRRVLYEMRMPPDAYEKLNEIATSNNMAIDDALCALLDDARRHLRSARIRPTSSTPARVPNQKLVMRRPRRLASPNAAPVGLAVDGRSHDARGDAAQSRQRTALQRLQTRLRDKGRRQCRRRYRLHLAALRRVLRLRLHNLNPRHSPLRDVLKQPRMQPGFGVEIAAQQGSSDDRYNVGPVGSWLTSSMTSAPFGAFIAVGSSAS
jgi:hypothetical protein